MVGDLALVEQTARSGARRAANPGVGSVHLGIDVATVEGGYMPERSVAVRSEGMQCVRRHHDYVACCRDDVNAVDAIDAAPLRYDEHLAPVVAMLPARYHRADLSLIASVTVLTPWS